MNDIAEALIYDSPTEDDLEELEETPFVPHFYHDLTLKLIKCRGKQLLAKRVPEPRRQPILAPAVDLSDFPSGGRR